VPISREGLPSVADAARNNAAWCNAVCSSHGSPGELRASHWVTWAPAPPLYPNLVTVDPAVEPAMATIRELERARPSASWAVKDSFDALPLEDLGFRLLFGAEWIARRPPPSRAGEAPAGGRWRRIDTEAGLAAWEEAWGESRRRARIFLPALLGRREIAILASFGSAGTIRAGVIANRGENAVGLSNFFACGEERAALRAECVDAAAAAFPSLPLVGYESGPDLADAKAVGFASIGPLRIWAAGPPTG